MTEGLTRIERALVSVSDKTGLVDFVRRLQALDIEIISTGGTARALRDAGIAIIEVAEFTGSPEILDGRVKTLHPHVHGGILFRRDSEKHRQTCRRQEIHPIDLVVVNLYPFRDTIRRPDTTRAEAIEQIDIGGPALLRSAAKNHEFVTVVCNPDLYGQVLAEVEARTGQTSLALRRRLALEAFRHTAQYDTTISGYLASEDTTAASGTGSGELPDDLAEYFGASSRRAFTLRYGENNHQAGAFYGDFAAHFVRLHGLELSYNNILDLSAAVELVEDFPVATPVAAIVKHTNPCGVATATSALAAWEKALATDEKSAHGGVVAFNRAIDLETAEVIHPFFTEILAAPDFTPEALEFLQRKKNRRLIRCSTPLRDSSRLRLRSAAGGLLGQEADHPEIGGLDGADDFRVVTRRAPTSAEDEALRFAWKVAKHLKSNAVAFTTSDRSLGLGAGQMSRVDAAEIAVMKATGAGIDLSGSVVASDAFFPFADGLLVCARAGATAVIQPGGAKRDSEVITAADDRGMAMIFTGRRHFRH